MKEGDTLEAGHGSETDDGEEKSWSWMHVAGGTVLAILLLLIILIATGHFRVH